RIGSPPLARGILRVSDPSGCVEGITPARAGNTYGFRFMIKSTWDHPRSRGEYHPMRTVQTLSTGSPPLARGILYWKAGNWKKYGITPARAGNTKRSL